MLRGVAARLSGNALMRGGNEDGALGLYQDSLALLEKIGCPLEAAKRGWRWLHWRYGATTRKRPCC